MLSIHGMDTISYGRDLRTYLLNELVLDSYLRDRSFDEALLDSIPFWGEVLSFNGYGPADRPWNIRAEDWHEGVDERHAEFDAWDAAQPPGYTT